MNNLVLNKNSKISDVCVIRKSIDWRNSIDIIISSDSSLDSVRNHFLVIKSYLYSDMCIVKSISVIMEKYKDDYGKKKFVVVDNLNVGYMYRIDFNDYITWYLNYYLKFNSYSFDVDDGLIYYRLSLIYNGVNIFEYVPEYPWSDDWCNINKVRYYK